MTTQRMRDAARAIVLDRDDRILLVRFRFPDRGFWGTPGGGVDPGESHEQALRRELGEELGLAVTDVGPCIWRREHLFENRFGPYHGQRERYFLLRIDRFDPSPGLTREQLEDEYVFEIRWWTQDELASSPEPFEPTRLTELIASLLANGPPTEPIDIGR